MCVSDYMIHFYDICNFLFSPFYTLIFKKSALRLSNEDIATLQNIGSWYILEYFTYIQVFGMSSSPHLFPTYIPNRLLIREIVYQIVIKVVGSQLSCMNKKECPSFLISVDPYTLKNSPHARK